MTNLVQYRVVKVTTDSFGKYTQGKASDVVREIIWQGSDTAELSRQYPPSEIFGADPLSHSEIEDGLIHFDYRFEHQVEDGSWKRIKDPRRRLTPVTTLEREIDAENRRLFPGDYEDYCPDCGYASCLGECQ